MERSVRYATRALLFGLLIAGSTAFLLACIGRLVAAQSPTPTLATSGTPAFPGLASSVMRGASELAGGASVPTRTQEPAATPGPESRGPGTFDLSYPGAGLETLPGYRAQMQVTIEGTSNGMPIRESESFTLTASAAPAAHLLWTDTGAGSSMDAEIGGVRYTRIGARCHAEVVADPDEGGFLPIAAALPTVLGAEEVGALETMQGIPVRHYRFDGRALNLSGLTDAAGEVWVADKGNFVVRYILRAEGKSSDAGRSWTVTKTWTYLLSDVAQDSSMELPADCPAGLIGVPLPQDATDVSQRPGYTRFTTGLSPKDVAAFYTQGLPDWQSVGDHFADAKQAVLMFSQEDHRLTISASAGPKTTVTAFLSRGESPAKGK